MHWYASCKDHRDERRGRASAVEEEAVDGVVDTSMTKGACDRILQALRSRLAEVEAWTDGAIKDVAQEAVRGEMARVGRERLEREWRWA